MLGLFFFVKSNPNLDKPERAINIDRSSQMVFALRVARRNVDIAEVT